MDKKRFNSMFWGIVILVIGVLLIVDYYADLHISIIRMIFAILFIYAGIMLTFGRSLFKSKGSIIFSDASYKIDNPEKEYSIVFSSGKLDLSEVSQQAKSVKVNVAFGEGRVLVDSKRPVKIKLSSAFGEGILPDGSSVNFGTNYYESKGESAENLLIIDANVAFGELVISNKK